MTTKDLIASLKKLSALRYGSTLRPHRDWLILLVVALIALLASLAWNVWFFFELVDRDLSGAESAEAPATLDRSALEAAREAMTEQSAEEARYKGEYQFVDPSR